jgi:hypothetical protein
MRELPKVPDQVSYLFDDRFREVHEKWASMSLDDLHTEAVEYASISRNGSTTRSLILEPKGERNDTTVVLALPHQQAAKDSMIIRARIAQELVAPNSRMVLLPNNSDKGTYYDFSENDIARLRMGLMPLAEQQMRMLESLRVEKAVLSGYSLGGLAVAALAAMPNTSIDVIGLNIDEAPSKNGRTAKELKKDFLSSGGWGAQRAAIKDAQLPILNEVQSIAGLAIDYAHFGLASLSKSNKAIAQGMDGNTLAVYLNSVRRQYPDAPIKLGKVVGSKLLEIDSEVLEYTGVGTHMHATGDNPFAHALMMKHGLQDALAA